MTDLSNQIFPYPTDPTPILTEDVDLLTLDSLLISELKTETVVEIVESVTSLSVTLRANGLSQINFSVYDPNFEMHSNNYFLVGRIVEFNGMLYEISNVSLNHKARDMVQVIARNYKMQRIRRAKGNHSWGAISPTALARLTAKKYGLGFVGESSPVNGTLRRVSNDQTDESTYDVLKTLANKLEFMFFEAKDYLFFASQDHIVDVQGQTRIFIPGRDAEIDPVTGGYVTDVLFPLSVQLSRDEDREKPIKFSASLHTNATTQQLYPGLGCSFKRVAKRVDPDNNQIVSEVEEPFPNYEDLFMIDQVSYNMTPNTPTSIAGTSIKPSADMLCSIQEFKEGDEGTCVKRIQRAIGMAEASIDGVYDSETALAVREFQLANIHAYRDAPQFSGDNWKAYLTLGEVGRVTWSWIKAVNMTVPIPPRRPSINPDDMAPPDLTMANPPDPADDPIFGYSGIYQLPTPPDPADDPVFGDYGIYQLPESE